MIINNSSCTKKRKNKYNRKQTYCQYDFWKCSQIFPWRLKGFSRCDITALFLYYQQTKGALRSTWRLEWRIQGGTVNWWMSPTTHEGGLHVAALKSTNCLQICSVKTGCSVGGVGGWGGTVVWKFPALSLSGLLLVHCSVLFSTRSTAALHPPDSQLREETPAILRLETGPPGKVRI